MLQGHTRYPSISLCFAQALPLLSSFEWPIKTVGKLASSMQPGQPYAVVGGQSSVWAESVQYRHKKRIIAQVSSMGLQAFDPFARTSVLEKLNVKTWLLHPLPPESSSSCSSSAGVDYSSSCNCSGVEAGTVSGYRRVALPVFHYFSTNPVHLLKRRRKIETYWPLIIFAYYQA